MTSKYDSERTIGKVVRSGTGDILEDFKLFLEETYKDDKGVITELGKKYIIWSLNIAGYFQNKTKRNRYLRILRFVMWTKQIDPSKNEFWKSLLACEVTPEFFEYFDNIDTQLTKLFSRNFSGDKGKGKKTEEEKWY